MIRLIGYKSLSAYSYYAWNAETRTPGFPSRKSGGCVFACAAGGYLLCSMSDWMF